MVVRERNVQAGRPSKYSDKFRKGSLARYWASDRSSVKAVADRRGVNHGTLRQWIQAANEADAPGGPAAMAAEEHAELVRLRRAEPGRRAAGRADGKRPDRGGPTGGTPLPAAGYPCHHAYRGLSIQVTPTVSATVGTTVRALRTWAPSLYRGDEERPMQMPLCSR